MRVPVTRLSSYSSGNCATDRSASNSCSQLFWAPIIICGRGLLSTEATLSRFYLFVEVGLLFLFSSIHVLKTIPSLYFERKKYHTCLK